MVGLEGLAHPPPKHQLGTEEEFAARYPFLQQARDRSLFLGFAAKVMLYQPPALLPRVMPTAATNPSEACHSFSSLCNVAGLGFMSMQPSDIAESYATRKSPHDVLLYPCDAVHGYVVFTHAVVSVKCCNMIASQARIMHGVEVGQGS